MLILGPGCRGRGHLGGALLPVMADPRKALNPQLGADTLSLPPHPSGHTAEPKQRAGNTNPVCPWSGRMTMRRGRGHGRREEGGGIRAFGACAPITKQQPHPASPRPALLAPRLPLSPCLISAWSKSGRPFAVTCAGLGDPGPPSPTSGPAPGSHSPWAISFLT